MAHGDTPVGNIDDILEELAAIRHAIVRLRGVLWGHIVMTVGHEQALKIAEIIHQDMPK